MITLTINGQEATVQEGATILEAAKSIGIEIPTLCHDPRIVPMEPAECALLKSRL